MTKWTLIAACLREEEAREVGVEFDEDGNEVRVTQCRLLNAAIGMSHWVWTVEVRSPVAQNGGQR